MILHDYWRSGAGYRARIALNLKGLTYERLSVNLRAGAQRDAAYRGMNPQGLVPLLEAEDRLLPQSPAIIEWLEERYPDPPLLPKPLEDRAIVRAMAAVVGCDIHPLNNLRVLQHLRDQLKADEAAVGEWIGRWICSGFKALDEMIGRHGGLYAFGQEPTLADCYIVPQVYSAERFAVNIGEFANIARVAKHARIHPAFAAAHPAVQHDAAQAD